ncbi:MAG: DUF3108 domain-containing protein [Pseudobdellovibrionaceae bacterium]
MKSKIWQRLAIAISVLVVAACASSFLKYERADQLKSNDEFSKAVKIEEVKEAAPASTGVSVGDTAIANPSAGVNGKKNQNKKIVTSVSTKKSKSKTKVEQKSELALQRLPDIEDAEGFLPGSRRPITDPFRIGETLTYDVHYFKVTAGEMKMKVNPLVAVNGNKSYHFSIDIKSSSLFSSFYRVDDQAEVFLDYADLIPRVFNLHVKESGQLREARSYFDFEKNKAFYWEKKVTKKNGEEEKKQEWDILPYSQSVFSAIFYMRLFQWKSDKEYAFRVSDDKENLVFKGKAIRREKLSTEVGDFDTVVIKPEFTLQGTFKPIGDIFIWLSDDDRKLILRIESSIKIGTLVAEVTKIE